MSITNIENRQKHLNAVFINNEYKRLNQQTVMRTISYCEKSKIRYMEVIVRDTKAIEMKKYIKSEHQARKKEVIF